MKNEHGQHTIAAASIAISHLYGPWLNPEYRLLSVQWYVPPMSFKFYGSFPSPK